MHNLKRMNAQYAVFVEPEGPLKQHILAQKQSVSRQFECVAYGNHPPHCTLIAGKYSDPESMNPLLTRAVSPLAPFEIRTQGYRIFYDDPLAGGGHTIVLSLIESPVLSALQLRVADVVAQSGRADLSGEERELFSAHPYRRSMEIYGFPFVGSHWIPHFTIASVKVRRNARELKEYLSLSPNYVTRVDHISLWKVEGDKHVKLFTVGLKRR